jgi:hypothetical protein
MDIREHITSRVKTVLKAFTFQQRAIYLPLCARRRKVDVRASTTDSQGYLCIFVDQANRLKTPSEAQSHIS